MTVKDKCPECGLLTENEDDAWFFTCPHCGKGVNLLKRWYREQEPDERSFEDLSSEEKMDLWSDYLEYREWIKNEEDLIKI